MDFRLVIDHTFLKTECENNDAKNQQSSVIKLCEEAAEAGAASICIRPNWIALAKQELRRLKAATLITTVIGFPNGALDSVAAKVAALHKARLEGADEYDYVIDFNAANHQDWQKLQNEAWQLSLAAGMQTLKAIVETSLWEESRLKEILTAVIIGWQKHKDGGGCGDRFLKTSTGFGSRGANLSDIAILRNLAPEWMGIKASGGVKSAKDALSFWQEAGSKVKNGKPDPRFFRIGSSSLLQSLDGTKDLAEPY